MRPVQFIFVYLQAFSTFRVEPKTCYMWVVAVGTGRWREGQYDMIA